MNEVAHVLRVRVMGLDDDELQVFCSCGWEGRTLDHTDNGVAMDDLFMSATEDRGHEDHGEGLSAASFVWGWSL